MYGGPEFVFGAMLPFPNQKPIPGVMVQRGIDGLGNGTENFDIVMFWKESDISPEEMYALKLFNYGIIEKHLPINISLNKKE
ncbi:hypothetical protein FG386_002230 [Cryptosporidium ryanae]|uniref:uncharacterized protein n=1 Tax=Cryptosporidium ryanae TaxID=515981 RepID=UPI00351A1B8D|nr:hypothetical protein FG386_002230 [Cryptosporidium ryanae]